MKLENLYVTRNVEELMQHDNMFRDEINSALSKFVTNNWGITCPEDQILNDIALTTNERIIAVYKTCRGKIWIITESGHEITTILFPSEY